MLDDEETDEYKRKGSNQDTSEEDYGRRYLKTSRLVDDRNKMDKDNKWHVNGGSSK